MMSRIHRVPWTSYTFIWFHENTRVHISHEYINFYILFKNNLLAFPETNHSILLKRNMSNSKRILSNQIKRQITYQTKIGSEAVSKVLIFIFFSFSKNRWFLIKCREKCQDVLVKLEKQFGKEENSRNRQRISSSEKTFATRGKISIAR